MHFAVYGRLPIYVATLLLATLFEVACAIAPSMPALIILRFFAGFFSSAPLSNAGGSLNDIGNSVIRTIALPIYAWVGFTGTVIGPIITGFIVDSPVLNWTWAFWVTAIYHAFSLVLTFIFMPETLAPALLRYKAIKLRRTTGLPYKSEAEDISLREATVRCLVRPFQILVREPIVQLFVLYLSGELSYSISSPD
jgi:DHA1 family multidrug resistance protein-like MFS transporter